MVQSNGEKTENLSLSIKLRLINWGHSASRQAINDDFNWVIMLLADEVGTGYLLALKFID